MTKITVSALLHSMQSVDKNAISDAERQQLLLAAQDLAAKVENPWDTIKRLVWIEPAQQASLKTMIDLKLFEKWVAAGGGVKTPKELGEMVGCDPELLERLFRVIASTGLASNPGPHQYEMTDFSKSLAEPMQSAAIRYWYEVNIPIYQAMPSYLAHGGYKNPTAGPNAACWNWAKNFTGTYFDYLNQHPRLEQDFGMCMSGYAGHLTPWTDIYPTEELVSGGDPNDVVVVDVGGSLGHDLKLLQAKHSLGPGRLVLQDLPEVIERAEVDNSIRSMAHDFLTPQPIKGARAYYLHSVAHDWPDRDVQQILENLKPALEKGKSKVLLHEMIIWPQGNSPHATHSDVLMMGAFNGGERSVEAWTALVEPLGYRITRTHTLPNAPQGILQLEL